MKSKPTRALPVTGWVIVSGFWRGGFVFNTRREAIDNWCQALGNGAYLWESWYRHDYRCVRVTVQEAAR